MGDERLNIFRAWVLAAVLCGCTNNPSTSPSKREAASQDLTNRAHAHMELGMGYYESGKHQFAIEELNEALKARPDYVPAHSGLALVYMELREDKKAEAAFKKALRYEPGNSSARNNYGQFLCSRGRTEEGLRQLLEAVKNPLYQAPDTAYQNAGVCARRIGDNTRAEEYFRQAVMRNPRHAQALLNLSDLNYLKKNYPTGKNLCRPIASGFAVPRTGSALARDSDRTQTRQWRRRDTACESIAAALSGCA
ncbi:MAG: type IV pilus biogenesis/stability protein PilW [Betaproteobacteria bacterium]|nr:type IV pilus biogenesis/stability protein PilW [Betaproteobacteria bacterium]